MFKKFLPIIKGLLRHGLTIVGGALVVTGIMSHEQSVEFMGIITSGIAVVQSVHSSSKKDFTQRFQGVIRHFLTFLGGFGLLKGWYSSEQFYQLVSALAIFGGSVWSILSKKIVEPELPADSQGSDYL